MESKMQFLLIQAYFTNTYMINNCLYTIFIIYLPVLPVQDSLEITSSWHLYHNAEIILTSFWCRMKFVTASGDAMFQ